MAKWEYMVWVVQPELGAVTVRTVTTQETNRYEAAADYVEALAVAGERGWELTSVVASTQRLGELLAIFKRGKRS